LRRSMMGIILKTPEEIAIMRRAGRIVAEVLARLTKEIRPGVTTGELDAMAAEELAKLGARASFLGYHGFPAHICTSVNEQVVHGIPGERALREGDIVAIDVGALVDGFHGDAAITLPVGKASDQAISLIDATRGALAAGISAGYGGARLGDISAAIQRHAESHGFSVVREYVGHGIGRDMHEEPKVANFGIPGQGPLLREGMTIALEPMVNAGGWRTRVADDFWTVSTMDGSLSAHFEHTIAITDGEAQVLTAL